MNLEGETGDTTEGEQTDEERHVVVVCFFFVTDIRLTMRTTLSPNISLIYIFLIFSVFIAMYVY